MSQKRCLNCQDYKPDEKDLHGEPIPPGRFCYSGVCQRTNTRKEDGWACGEWKPKSLIPSNNGKEDQL